MIALAINALMLTAGGLIAYIGLTARQVPQTLTCKPVRTANNDPVFWSVTSPHGQLIASRNRLRQISDAMGWNHASMKSSAIRRGKYLGYSFERVAR